MILAYAGRRAQSLGGDLEDIAGRIREVVSGLQPQMIVGAAADGADLLVLEAALTLPDPPQAHVILPTTRRTFRDDSVAQAWQDRFDAALLSVIERGGEIQTMDLEPGEDAYRRANQAILDRAIALADGTRSVGALVIASPGQGAMIEDLIGRAVSMEVQVHRIDPATHSPGE